VSCKQSYKNVSKSVGNLLMKLGAACKWTRYSRKKIKSFCRWLTAASKSKMIYRQS